MATPAEIQEIKDRLSIADVVGRYVPLKKAGSNFKALCPFHTEKSPSFMVNPALGIFKCFGCGEAGDVYAFVEKMEGEGFGQVVERLARDAGVTLTKTSLGQKQQDDRQPLFELNEKVTELFEKYLWEGKVGEGARAYLDSREIDPKVAKAFRLGYAPDRYETLTNQLPELGYTLGTVEQLGLIIKGDKGYYDRFRHRLMFPIFDPAGRIVGFSGRTLAGPEFQGAKYMNSPESSLYHKSQLLYGYHLAKPAVRLEQAITIVEGNVDVVRLHQCGYQNVVAPLGTALTPDQLRLIKRLCQRVYVAFDADGAGTKATLAALNLAENEGLDVRVIIVPSGKDPDDYVRANPKAWPELIAKAEGVMEFRLAQTYQNHDLSTGLGKQQAVHAALDFINRLESEVSRMHYLQQVAMRIQMPIETLIAESTKLRRRGSRPRSASDSPSKLADAPVHPTEKLLLELALFDATVRGELGTIDPAWIQSAVVLELIESIIRLPGGDFAPAGLYGTITESAQRLIESLMFAHEGDTAEDPLELFAAIRRRLTNRYIKSQLKALTLQISQLDQDAPPAHLTSLQNNQQRLREQLDAISQQEDDSYGHEES